jgi:hypothetical protein
LEKPKSAIISGNGFKRFIKDAEQKYMVIPYGISILCFVSNMGVGLQEKLSPVESSETSKRIMPQLEEALTHALAALPLTRNCFPCNNALEHARFT